MGKVFLSFLMTYFYLASCFAKPILSGTTDNYTYSFDKEKIEIKNLEGKTIFLKKNQIVLGYPLDKECSIENRLDAGDGDNPATDYLNVKSFVGPYLSLSSQSFWEASIRTNASITHFTYDLTSPLKKEEFRKLDLTDFFPESEIVEAISKNPSFSSKLKGVKPKSVSHLVELLSDVRLNVGDSSNEKAFYIEDDEEGSEKLLKRFSFHDIDIKNKTAKINVYFPPSFALRGVEIFIQIELSLSKKLLKMFEKTKKENLLLGKDIKENISISTSTWKYYKCKKVD